MLSVAAQRRGRPEARTSLPAIALLAAICLASVLVLVLLGTRLTFFNDDWYFLLQRPGLESHGGLDVLLAPHNSQSVLLTALAYKLLVAVFGLGSQVPFRIVLALALATAGVFIYLLVSARAGAVIGLAAAAVIVFLGCAWEDLLFFASLDLVGSLATGLGALWALQRDSPRRNALGCVLLLGSVGFSNVGVPFAVGAVIAIALRRRPGQLWIVAVPAILFALWWLLYGTKQTSHLSSSNIEHLPRYVYQSLTFAVASATGANRGSVPATLRRGHIELAVLVVVIVVCLFRGWRPRASALVPASALLAFWLLTGASYYFGREPSASRYQLIDAALLIVLAAELYEPPRWEAAVNAIVVLAAIFVVWSNIDGGLSYGYRFMRAQSGFVKADLAALELGRPLTPPSLRLLELNALNPFLSGVTAGRLFDETAAHGQVPAYSVAQLASAPPSQRQAADSVLALAERMAPIRIPARSRLPGGCTRLLASGRAASPELIVHPGRWSLRDIGRGVLAVGLRRFAPPGEPKYVTLLGHGAAARLMVPNDGILLPWRLSAKGIDGAALEVCRG